jgi:beta-phosphoglucomutase
VAGWFITEEAFVPEELHHKETVFTLGNGYLGTRGSFEEGYPGARPATLIHGVYDDLPPANTELANAPDWPSLSILVDGERFGLDRGTVLSYRRDLDMRRGVLSRAVRWQSPAGHIVDLHFERFASLADPHLLAVRCQVMSVEAACDVQVHAGLSAYPENLGLLHWTRREQGGEDDSAWLQLTTRHSGIDLGMAVRLGLNGGENAQIQAQACPGYPMVQARFRASPGQPVTLTKIVTVVTSRDVEGPLVDARHRLPEPEAYEELMAAHEAAWAEVWRDSDVIIEGNADDQAAIRYNLFQTLIAAPRHDDRVSIGAKTLSGFGYRGHVFWDTELFILPFLIYTQPHIARNLLSYRYLTLPGARRKAEKAGYGGAMIAWESAATGDDVTPPWVLDPAGIEMVRIWPGEIEQHISADVAYGTWQYWDATGDDEWMAARGAQIILETAVFWASRVEYNETRDRYEITNVIGPDEYHDHVDNNAFTNRLVKWHLETALEVLAWLRGYDPSRAAELESALDLSPERLAHWANIAGCMYVPHDPETGLIEQFEGFFRLKDLDLEDYEPRTRSMHAILGIEGANEAQVIKQADVLMLLFLLRGQAEYDDTTLAVNWDYYYPRTDHSYGSSLGPPIHAILASEMDDPVEAYKHFWRTAYMDLENLRGNTPDGIHAAAAGALWQSVVFGFGGLRVTPEGLVATPHLPAEWSRLRFRVTYRGQWHEFDLEGQYGKAGQEPGRRSVAHGPTDGDAEIRAVIFDLDGVLTDTSELHYRSWKRLAEEERIPFDRVANEALRGIPRRDSLLLVLGDRPATEEEIQEMMARKNRYYRGYLEDLDTANLLPGVLPLLEELRAAGYRIAIGSASKNARAVVERLGLGQMVDAIADGHSVEAHKPAPDLFLLAADQLGVPPEECVVFEDAESGIEAALAAGMWAVGLGPEERVGQAHVVLPSLRGVRWADVRARLRRAAQDGRDKG